MPTYTPQPNTTEHPSDHPRAWSGRPGAWAWLAVSMLLLTFGCGVGLILLSAHVACGQGRTAPALLLGNEALPPMCFLERGKPRGIVVDLAEALAKNMRRPVEVRLADWAEAQRLVREGRADALLQINPSSERLALYDFSAPLLRSEFMIFTGADRLGVAGLRDLRGLRVGVERQGLPIQLLQAHPEIITTPVPDLARGFALLAKGEVDAVIADRWVGAYLLARDRIGGVRMVREPVAHSESAIAVRKGDTTLLADINASIATLRRSGEYAAILDRWRPKEVVFTTREQLRQQAWVTAGISALLLAALVSVALLVREVRRRRRVETALRESEARFRSVLDTSRDFIYRTNLQTGRYAYVSPSVQEVLGYTPDEFAGLDTNTIMAIIHPEDVAAVVTEMQRLEETGTGEAEYRLRNTQGEYRWVSNHMSVMKDSADRLLYRCGNVRDITDRKQAEEALRVREATLNGILDAAQETIWLFSTDGRVLLGNKTALQRFDKTAAELIGKHIRETVPAALADTRLAYLQLVIDTGQPLEFEDERAGIQFHHTFYPVFAADGRVEAIACFSRDITARKQAEEALHASLREKEVLLKEIHHRVKNNMQVISSLVSLQADTLDDPTLRPLFNDLSYRVRAMALVHEKLYQSESLAEIDFAAYASSLLKYLWHAQGDAAAAVRLTLDVHPASVSIEQAVPCGLMLNELVTNALKHAFRDRTDGELTVALHAAADGQVCLSVRDNGVGLPADWRQSPSLGLQLVQMLTRQVRGTLDVRTESGTTFTLTFAQPASVPHGEAQHAR